MNSPGSQLCKDNGLVFVLACVLCVMYLCLSYLSSKVEPPGSVGVSCLCLSEPVFLCIPDICHFFTLAKFLENKIYTEKTRIL